MARPYASISAKISAPIRRVPIAARLALAVGAVNTLSFVIA